MQGRLFKGTVCEYWTDAELKAIDVENMHNLGVEPKDFKWPRLYYQPAQDFIGEDRLRLIFPNGDSYWIHFNSWERNIDMWEDFFTHWPCWAYPRPRSGHKALKAMREYDKRTGFKPAEFVGEIK